MLKRVLVVDDDDELRETLWEALSYCNFQVKLMVDGSRLAEAINIFKPDLILLDYMLPGINGGELCEKIKNDPATSDLPVILMSAYQDVFEHFHCCSKILYKPFDLDKLLEVINDHLIDDTIPDNP